MQNPLQRIFSEIPERYELVNHALTFGLDVVWRRALAGRAVEVTMSATAGFAGKKDATHDARILDMCTGTGETAAYVARLSRPGTLVVGADFTVAMMVEGRKRRGRGEIAFVAADATALPFADGTFDLVTISFATRNLNVTREDLIAAFQEIRRVLRPGGVLLNLETSRPPGGLIRALFDCYARLIVPRLGPIISGTNTGYAYLSSSMRRFYGAEQLAAILVEAGFTGVRFRRSLLGAVALHEAFRGE